MPAPHTRRPRPAAAAACATLVRALALVVVAAVLALIPAGPASAHAELSISDPAAGSVVATAPSEITLQFTEGIAVQPDGIRVLDGNGARVDAGTASSAGDTVTAPLEGSVSDGGYVVAWRVVSADGHPIRGAFSFSVGQRTQVRTGLADEAFGASADSRDDVIGAVLRGLTYLAVLVTSGVVLIGAALRRPDEPSPVTRLLSLLAGLGVLTLLLQLPIQASLATGRGWGSLTESGVLKLALSDGVGWAIGITGLALVAVAVTAGLPFTGAARALALGGAALAPLGFVVTGHTRTMTPAAVAYAADAAHLLAGAVWLGGLCALLAVMRRRRAADDPTGAAVAVARFSGWAGIVVAFVVVTGTTLGWIEVGGLHALTSTNYGRLLMAKVALVGLVVAGAAWNRFRLVPIIEPSTVTEAPSAALVTSGVSAAAVPGGGDIDPPAPSLPDDEAGAAGVDGPPDPGPDGPEVARAWSQLTRVMRFEVVALVGVLAITAVLANVTPARTAEGQGVVSVSAKLGDGTVEVTVDPASPGPNDIHAYILDADGGADDRYDAAEFQLSLPAQDIGPLNSTPVRAGPGHFQLVGTSIDVAGEWTLTVIVKPDRFTEQAATVRFRVK